VRPRTQAPDPLRDRDLRGLQRRQENEPFALDRLGGEFAPLDLAREHLERQFLRHAKQAGGGLDECRLGDRAMALARRLGQHVRNSRPHAQHGIAGQPEAFRNGVGGFESDAVNVLRQAIRIAPDRADRVLAVAPKDPHRLARADAVRVEEDHDLANDALFLPCVLDAAPPLGADPRHLLEAGGLVLDNVENLIAKARDQLLRVNGSDPLDHPAREVFLDALA